MCSDGKIQFDSDVAFDFYPDEPFEGVFISCEGYSICSETYTREQWGTDLTKLDKPFGELDRATQLKLVEHVLDGGRVEKYEDRAHRVSFWTELNLVIFTLAFKNDTKYRAIQS